MLLADKVAIVTGAGSGIGEAIALSYAREGADVVLAEIDAATGEETAKQVEALGRRGLFVQTDMGRLSEVDAMVATAIAEFGRVDVLVNNAGVTRRLGFFEVTEEDWDWMHSVNAKGLFFCMQRVARDMVERRSGRIINIASIAGKGYTGTSNIAYAGTKGAVIAMTRIGAFQLAKHNINVNAICPGATITNLFDSVMSKLNEDQRAEMLARLDASIPLGRANGPEHIADAAVFLASPGAVNITGQSLNVDGGLVWD